MALTGCVSDSFGGGKGSECIKGLDESSTFFFFDCIRHKESVESITPTRHAGRPKDITTDRQTDRPNEKIVERQSN